MSKLQRNIVWDLLSVLDRSQRRARALIAVSAVAAVLAVMPAASSRGGDAPQPPDSNSSTAAPKKPTFDKVGPQVGDQLPDLKLRTLKGEAERLSDAWHGGPTLLVTSSFTCPKSRSRWPELKAIVEKYGERLNVVIVYVIEAHPVGSICPYKGVEDVTPENQRDDILRHQPKTLEDRLDLAKEFKRYLRVDVPIYVDTLDNQAWNAFGAAPNIAFLVDSYGRVVARQGWFDGLAMQKAVDAFLLNLHGPDHETSRPARTGWEKEQAVDAALEKAGLHAYDLHDATRQPTPDKLREILKKVPGAANFVFPIEHGHGSETTWLMDAVADGSPATAEELLKNGADVRLRTSSFDSALQEAAEVGQADMVKLLLRYGSDVNYPATGKTPLHEALIAGRSHVAQLLEEAGAKRDFWANVGVGKIEAVRTTLTADRSWALRPDGVGRMPLDYAAANGQIEIAKLLLENGAPIVDDPFSRTYVPLHYAIYHGSLPMVELLLKAGSSPDTALRVGHDAPETTPPLQMAIDANDIEILKMLLAYKADLNVRNTRSQTPLHYAAALGKLEIVELLIRAGADVNAPQLGYSTPCGSGEEETPSLNTPLHFAAAQGNPATIQLLLKSGAKIDARNVRGITPLMSTVEPLLYGGINLGSQTKNMELLLASGADINARDNDGETVLDIARAMQKAPGPYQPPQNVIDLLVKHDAKQGELKPKK
jgi:ankyrin repeat protein